MILFSTRTALWLSLFCSIIMSLTAACSRSDDDKSAGKSKVSDRAHSQTAAGGSGKALWVIDQSLANSKLFKIDPAARKVTHKIAVEGAPKGIAAGEGAVWVTDYANDKVLRVNPRSMQIESAIAVDRAPTSIVTGGGSVWAISSTEGILTRIDPASNKIVSRTHITNSVLTGLVYGENTVWVPSVNFLVTRVDPSSDKIAAQIHVIGNPGSPALAGGMVWLLNPTFKQLLKIDPAVNRATPVGLAGTVRFIASGRDALWLAEAGGTVSRLDIGSGEITFSFKAAGEVNALCFEEDTLWMSAGSEKKVLAVDPHSGKTLAALDIEGRPAALVFGP